MNYAELTEELNRYEACDRRIFYPVKECFETFATKESCGKCVPCREGSKRILECLASAVSEEITEELTDLLESLCDTIIATALCPLGKAACRYVLRSVLRYRGLGENHPGLVSEPSAERPVIHADKCRGCGKCRRGCPAEAIRGTAREPHRIAPALCLNCGACVSNCPFGAVTPADRKGPDEKGVMYVDGIRVPFEGESNVLSVIRKAGIELPTFCFHSELSVYGACRMCVVEDERGHIEASCSMVPRDGLHIRTNTGRLLRSRRIILELMLASHCRDCTTCEISGSCTLQRLAVRFGIRSVRFSDTRTLYERDESSPAVTLDLNRCVLCGDCIRMCSEVQQAGILRFSGKGSELRLVTADKAKLAETDCLSCGQCSAICPTGAIFIKNNIGEAWAALHDPKKRVIFQIAPAVRVAMGEVFGLPAGENVMNRLVSICRTMGAEAVYDTGFGADLTVMEEAEELLERLEKRERLPMFTSCCPAWVRFVETEYPEFLPNLSGSKSPMEMLGTVLREHYAAQDAADGRETYHIALMPCTAKKFEALRPEHIHDGRPYVDLVITTQEFSLMIKESGIIFEKASGDAPDMPFGLSSGAAIIFGTGGGVTEAVLRQLKGNARRETLVDTATSGVRGTSGLREFTAEIRGLPLNIAVVNGLSEAKQLLESIKAGEKSPDFVEVMACRAGCVGGAGQPRAKANGRTARAAGLYTTDQTAVIKSAEFNPLIQNLYSSGLVNRSDELLHVEYSVREP